jgi:hypothetical protein
MEDIMKLCAVVRETGFAIHRYHKHGHLVKVYEHCRFSGHLAWEATMASGVESCAGRVTWPAIG